LNDDVEEPGIIEDESRADESDESNEVGWRWRENPPERQEPFEPRWQESFKGNRPKFS